MEYIGKYYGREVFYLDKWKGYLDNLSESNWQCLLIANKEYRKDEVMAFARKAFTQNILGIHSQGKFGGQLDTDISLIRTEMEIEENYPDIDTSIGGDSETDLANVFWECFGAPALPERTDYDSLKLICISFDGRNYKNELKKYLNKFNDGWLPE